MLIFLKNTIKYEKIEELIGTNFERKPSFCNNITYTTNIKTLPSYSEDYQNIKFRQKKIIYKFSSIAILHSVKAKDHKCHPQT